MAPQGLIFVRGDLGDLARLATSVARAIEEDALTTDLVDEFEDVCATATQACRWLVDHLPLGSSR
ncbi:hypothetical protein Acsp05_33100 [Actinokineospora sp. NBRC 105648]|nr:hypothetical protein Acsp05_33100 [Actinokineospora sp. NBRC 105648]